MPRSPWLASPGCTKKAGLPVLAKVAAILPPMWPDLPMPRTTMRPVQCNMSSQACAKWSSIRATNAATARASMSSTALPSVHMRARCCAGSRVFIFADFEDGIAGTLEFFEVLKDKLGAGYLK